MLDLSAEGTRKSANVLLTYNVFLYIFDKQCGIFKY